MTGLRVDPLASPAPLIVYLDYKSTYAYLAKDPTYAIEDELGIEIDWRPFTLDIPSYLGSARLDDRGKVVEAQRSGGQWARVRYAYNDARRYGTPRGLIVRGTTKIWDSSLAGIGMLWAKAQGRTVLRTYTDRLYDRFWKRELDIEDAAIIERVLIESGAGIDGFQAYLAGEGRELHDEIQHAAFDAGIFGVPTYVIGSERFFGREHLPRIRWMLKGKPGPPPDVAYEDFAAADAATRPSLSVAIDFKSPFAYLAVGPTCALASEFGITVDWQPFASPWGKRPLSPSDDNRGARHRRFRAEYAEREVSWYAADRGLPLVSLYRKADSNLAAMGLLWSKRSAAAVTRAYLQRMFERYWRGELDLGDYRAISALLEEVGAPAMGFDLFAKREGQAEIERVQSELVKAGIFDVPAYRVDGELFIGRQHLPAIRSLLARSGNR